MPYGLQSRFDALRRAVQGASAYELSVDRAYYLSLLNIAWMRYNALFYHEGNARRRFLEYVKEFQRTLPASSLDETEIHDGQIEMPLTYELVALLAATKTTLDHVATLALSHARAEGDSIKKLLQATEDCPTLQGSPLGISVRSHAKSLAWVQRYRNDVIHRTDVPVRVKSVSVRRRGQRVNLTLATMPADAGPPNPHMYDEPFVEDPVAIWEGHDIDQDFYEDEDDDGRPRMVFYPPRLVPPEGRMPYWDLTLRVRRVVQDFLQDVLSVLEQVGFKQLACERPDCLLHH